MSQSRAMSLVEVSVSVATGLLLSLAMQAVLFPVVGLQASLSQNLKLAMGFTALSILRSYAVRRLFARIGTRRPRGAVRSLGDRSGDRREGPCAHMATMPTGGRSRHQDEEAG